ncbi:uncharacterized protein LOC112171314 [Rosa chinensis]|uniref:uncharacterized protein LOC112171314 n=1 Tax=Rosa chinensis TaxID=74649 RepID=UPI000D092A6C|nr:uncharacterized protein LOC112171314 [Rosa chinensis]
MIIKYYESIFSANASDPAAMDVVLDCFQPKVSREMNEQLTAPYLDEEIKKTLFQMHPSKSLGPDGMSPCFFQKFWNVVEKDVRIVVREILYTGQISQESNFTHLTLIPKIKEPKLVSDLRPIALCNVVYNIASKVMANRLKTILPQVISPLQSAFVPGRLISDNTLVATKIAHFMKKLRRQIDGFFSLKLDISKAYDRLEWRYLEAVLLKLGFCMSWVKIVLAIVKSGLSALISSSIQRGIVKGITLAPSAPTIHHLLFADDSFLFGEATIMECQAFKNILTLYAQASGQHVNLQKSSVVFSGNVSLNQKNQLAAILGVECDKEHGLSLGLPIHVGHNKTAIFAYLKERLTKKLISWRTKIPSVGGRELLVKPNHFVMIFGRCVVNSSGAARMESVVFIGGPGRECVSLKSKEGWRFLTSPNSLVAQVFKAVYYPYGSFLTADMGERPSYSWRSIMEASPVLEAGLQWRIGNGASIAARVLSIPLSRRFGHDRMAWKLHKKGFFTVKSAYVIAWDISIANVFASSSNGNIYGPIWRALWKEKVPNKVAIFGWRVVQNLLPTRAALARKGYSGDLQCVICSNAVENVEHLFSHCSLACEIVGAPPFSIPPSSVSWKYWFLEQVTLLSATSFDKLLVLLWSLWRNRNDKLWWNRSLTGPGIVASAMACYEEYSQANLVTAGFSYRVAFVSSALHVELLAMKSGLKLLHAMHVTKAILESNCLLAVHAINSVTEDMSDLGALVSEIKGLVATVGEVTVRFAPRQANMVAHRLANNSFETDCHLEWFTHAPEFVLDALMYDRNHI